MPIDRTALTTLTGGDGTGDPAVDLGPADAARALQVDLVHARILPWDDVAASSWRWLARLEAHLDEAPVNEVHGAMLLALADVIAGAPDARMVERANALFERATPRTSRLNIHQAASVVLACALAPDLDRAILLRSLATDLHARVRSFAQAGWPWPERTIGAESSLLPRAMIVAGERLGASTMRAIGLQLLDWLIDIQMTASDRLSLVGGVGWERGASRPRFPQRPAEATGLLLACEAAYSITGRDRYRETMERAFGWFSGANELGRAVVDPRTGTCAGLLTADGVAMEADLAATLEWLIAIEHIRALRPTRLSRGSGAAGGAAPRPAVAPSAT